MRGETRRRRKLWRGPTDKVVRKPPEPGAARRPGKLPEPQPGADQGPEPGAALTRGKLLEPWREPEPEPGAALSQREESRFCGSGDGHGPDQGGYAAPESDVLTGTRTGRDAVRGTAVGLPGAVADEWGEDEGMRDEGMREEREQPGDPSDDDDALSESQARIRRTLDAAVSRETAVDDQAGVPKQRLEETDHLASDATVHGRQDAAPAHAANGWQPTEVTPAATDSEGRAIGRASVAGSYWDQTGGAYSNSYGAVVSRETEPPDEEPPLALEARRAMHILNPSGDAMLPRPSRRRVVCIANQKGGVGKTTTAVNLAVSLALHGNRVLVIDLDPQGNASTGLGVEHRTGTPSVYEALLGEINLSDVARPVEGIPNLTCAPATIDLAGAEIELVSIVARESRLIRAIEAYEHELDYVFIDCPPSLGLLTVNALVAAEEVLIPIQCEYYALEGLGQLLRNIELVKAHLNPRLRVSTILLTMYDRRTKLADQVEQEVRSHFGDVVLETVIPRSVRVSEAPGYGQSVMTYDPGSRGATSYFGAAQEIAARGVRMPDSGEPAGGAAPADGDRVVGAAAGMTTDYDTADQGAAAPGSDATAGENS